MVVNQLEIRMSQAMNTYGSGAIGDFPELSLIILSPDINPVAWGGFNTKDQNKIEDKRLSKLFNMQYFVKPPIPANDRSISIQAHRFPATLFCPQCNIIYFVSELEKVSQPGTNHPDEENKGYICPECYDNSSEQKRVKNRLVPTRFVIATEYGHIDDFPWDWYCHRAPDKKPNRKECYKQKNGRNLKLNFSGGSAALSDISVECLKCKARESLGTIFDQEDTFMRIHDNYMNYVYQKMPVPWKGKNENNHFKQEDVTNFVDLRNLTEEDKKSKKKYFPRTLQRGAGNVYFPINYKAISIPEKSYLDDLNNINDDLDTDINAIFKFSPEFRVLQEESERIKLLINKSDDWLKDYLDKYDISYIKKYFNKKLSSQNKECSDSKEGSRFEEFNCFINFDYNLAEDKEWYKSEILDGTKFGDISKFIDKVVLLHKIRLINILKGFTRIRPLVLFQ